MAAKKPTASPVEINKYHSYLSLYKARRFRVIVAVVVLSIIATALLFSAWYHHESWHFPGLVIALLSSLLVFLAPSEEWHYAPWQARPHRFEKIMFD